MHDVEVHPSLKLLSKNETMPVCKIVAAKLERAESGVSVAAPLRIILILRKKREREKEVVSLSGHVPRSPLTSVFVPQLGLQLPSLMAAVHSPSTPSFTTTAVLP
ncbi:hypothetical protein CK203_101767 [Vitis vinifera]|uniref:Uncharacterized protein n=1 Tax=Vitis vinifera TaxID=29760 RepID=A0A438FB14_VITVI|nr:hypothetical protein CK203_101767 [Vitis vinifera]